MKGKVAELWRYPVSSRQANSSPWLASRQAALPATGSGEC